MSNGDFGKRLQALRKGADMTQEELAKGLGVSNQAVSKWELGNCYPDVELLPVLADVYGVSVDELLGHVPQGAKSDVLRRIRTLFAGTPKEEVFALALSLAGQLHEGVCTLGYGEEVPWKTGQDTGTLDWGFSARVEQEGASARRGRAAFFYAAGREEMPNVGALRRLAATLAPLEDWRTLQVLYALASVQRMSPEDLASACRISQEELQRILGALPLDEDEDGIALLDGYLHIPPLLSLIQV